MLQLSDEHFMSSLYWPVYRTPSPQKKSEKEERGVCTRLDYQPLFGGEGQRSNPGDGGNRA